jgi:hypothetical protein
MKKLLLSFPLTLEAVLNTFDVESMGFSDGITLKCGKTDPQINLALPNELEKPENEVLCEISYTNTEAGVLQVFWDYGEGASEENSTKMTIFPTTKTQSILLPVVNWQKNTKLTAFRIDPPNETEFFIKGVKFLKEKTILPKIIKKNKKDPVTFSKNRILAEMSFIDTIPDVNIFDIESMEKSPEGIILLCGETDPQIYLSLPNQLEKPLGTVFCEITYTNTEAGVLQVFWDYGEGSSEENSTKTVILPAIQTKQINLVVKNWHLSAKLAGLRIDPPNRGKFILGNISIINGGIRLTIVELIKKITEKIISRIYRNVPLKIMREKYIKQKEHYDLVCKNLTKKMLAKQKIRVAFMINYNTLFHMRNTFETMLNDNVFDPYIIIVPDILREEENMLKQLEKSYQFFTALYGYEKVLLGYIKEANIFIDYSGRFDIFCFSNPYETMTHVYFRMEYLKNKDVLTFYIEYGHEGITRYGSEKVVKLPIMSLFWKIFTESKISLKVYQNDQSIKGKNVIVCGYYNFDRYKNIKKCHQQRKCIIIAPHHTITNNDELNLSNFLEYADFFLELPCIYPDIDFVFRPHPLLILKLEEEDIWGKEKTDVWLSNLLANKNVTYSDGGDYIGLFVNSDAIIHDCASFTLDYLFTEFPCCYMLRKDKPIKKEFTKFGIQCLNQYYKAYENSDIINFIDNVVLKNIDSLRRKREKFAKKYLYQEHNTSEKIIHKIKKEIIDSKNIGKSGRLCSFDQFLNFFPDNKVLFCRDIKLSYSPPRFENDLSRSTIFEGIEYTQYAIKLKNAMFFGNSNLIVKSDKVLYDLPSYDRMNRFSYTDYRIIIIENGEVTFRKTQEVKIKKAIWMGGNYSWNYFHALYEFAIKFILLKNLNISTKIPILVDEVCLKIPQFNELFNIVNKKKYQLIPVSMECDYMAKELYYINCPMLIPPNYVDGNDVRPEDVQYNVSLLKELRNILLPHSSEKIFPEKVYISRKYASETSGRRRFNEDEVTEFFIRLGFKVFFPENLSIGDQIALFSQAKYIAGGSGAAFTNLLFCNEQCKCIIFSKSYLPISIFSTIAHIVGMDLRYVTEEATKGKRPGPLHDAFKIDITYLENFMMTWGIK